MTDRGGDNLSTAPSAAGAAGKVGLNYWQIVWQQFRCNIPAVIGLFMVILLFTMAVFAPFIANKYPYFWCSESEGLTFPLFRTLTNQDLVMFAAYVLVPAIALTRRLLRRTGWRFWELYEIRRAVVVNSLVLLVVVLGLWGFRSVPGRIKDQRTGIERSYRDEIANGEASDVTYGFPPIPYSPTDTFVGPKFSPPTARHILGTDSSGRSAAARIVFAARTSLGVGFISVGLSVLIGILAGGISGYFGGWVDIALQRVMEVFICFPTFFLMLFVISMWGPKLWIIMIAIGLTRWSGTARLIRAEILKIRTLDYVTAARALGVRPMGIILRHAVPNSLAPVLVSATFGIAAAVGFEAGLSFLGFGPPDAPSWGALLNNARGWSIEHPSLLIIPGGAIFLAVLAYNLVGEGLRDAVDPRLKV